MATTNAQDWRARVQPLTDVPPELSSGGFDDRLFGSPVEVAAALAEIQERLAAYRQRTGAAPAAKP